MQTADTFGLSPAVDRSASTATNCAGRALWKARNRHAVIWSESYSEESRPLWTPKHKVLW